jgi:hypothetical protein
MLNSPRLAQSIPISASMISHCKRTISSQNISHVEFSPHAHTNTCLIRTIDTIDSISACKSLNAERRHFESKHLTHRVLKRLVWFARLTQSIRFQRVCHSNHFWSIWRSHRVLTPLNSCCDSHDWYNWFGPSVFVTDCQKNHFESICRSPLFPSSRIVTNAWYAIQRVCHWSQNELSEQISHIFVTHKHWAHTTNTNLSDFSLYVTVRPTNRFES